MHVALLHVGAQEADFSYDEIADQKQWALRLTQLHNCRFGRVSQHCLNIAENIQLELASIAAIFKQ